MHAQQQEGRRKPRSSRVRNITRLLPETTRLSMENHATDQGNSLLVFDARAEKLKRGQIVRCRVFYQTNGRWPEK